MFPSPCDRPVFANKAAVESANRASRKLPFVQLPFPHRLRLLSWILLRDANVWNVVASGESAFIAYCRKAAPRSACVPRQLTRAFAIACVKSAQFDPERYIGHDCAGATLVLRVTLK